MTGSAVAGPRRSAGKHTISMVPSVDRRRDYPSPVKAAVVIAAATAAAIGCAVPAEADPLVHPVPYIEHDGTYLVGKDIRPGLYLTLGAAGAGDCSWVRRSAGGSGDASNVIERGESNDAQYALIEPTDNAFETHGCQAWRIGTRPATPIQPPGPTCIYPLTGCIDPNAR